MFKEKKKKDKTINFIGTKIVWKEPQETGVGSEMGGRHTLPS